MSEKLCALKKIGGGTLKETTLWTNASPTSNFVGQIVTLSESLDNYNALRFYYNKATSSSTTVSYIDVPKDIFTNMGGAGITLYADYPYCRSIQMASSNQITFGNTMLIGVNVSSYLNHVCVPTKICGLS